MAPAEIHPEPWHVIGVVKSGNYLIVDDGGLPVATVVAVLTMTDECRSIAHLLARSAARQTLLENVLRALLADDDGARHEDLIGLLQVELQRTIDYR